MRGVFIGVCTGVSLILFMIGALFATIGDESGGAICMVFATVSGCSPPLPDSTDTMSTIKPKLRAVTAKPVPTYRCPVRPEWAHPANEHHRIAYARAIRYLRKRAGPSRWVMDKQVERK